MSFADTFVFSRPTTAPYVDLAGVTQTAAIDQPRFDHRGTTALGLVVEAGADLGQGDRIRMCPRDWPDSSAWTVVHEWNDGTADRRDAHYTADPQAMIEGCLAACGRHRRIAAVEGYLQNYGTWVWMFGARWTLQPLVGARGGAVVSVRAGVPLIAA